MVIVYKGICNLFTNCDVYAHEIQPMIISRTKQAPDELEWKIMELYQMGPAILAFWAQLNLVRAMIR